MPEENAIKHIGIAIEMGQPFGHHHGCYKGVVDYVREHHPDWRTRPGCMACRW